MKTPKIPYQLTSSILLLIVLISFCGCKKFVDVGAPNSQLITAKVYTNDNTLKSALAGMFSTMANTAAYDQQFKLSFLTACSSDELKYFATSVDYDPFLNNSIPTDNSSVLSLWSSFYASIYQANAVIGGIAASTGGLSDAMKTEALGEAKFVRAYCYFQLTSLWGDVPMPLTTDGVTNNSLSRSTSAVVYQQIIKDLTDAQAKLNSTYTYGNSERVRPNKYAAAALLARVYLYTGDYANAQTNATTVIAYPTLYTLLSTANLGGIFVKNNTEAIFQLTATATVGFTQEAQYYSLDITTVPDYQLNDNLLKAFESGDKRYTNWVGIDTYSGKTYYYPYKYKQKVLNSTATGEYATYLRLAEQYLIRAETMARQNNLSGAIADINVIRSRAGLANTTAATQTDILLAIERERRIELFGEYGHRWNDLKRTGRANAVLGALKTGWTANAALYPVPKSEINNNRNLTQNPGY